MKLGFGVAVAVAQSGSCSSALTPRLGTLICHGCGPKKTTTTTTTTPPPIITVMWLIAPLYPFPVSVAGELDTALDLSSFCGDTTEIYQ